MFNSYLIAPRSPTEETRQRRGGLYFVAKVKKRARKQFQPPSERFCDRIESGRN